MKTLTVLGLLILIALSTHAQKLPLADISNHYKTLSQYSSAANDERRWMDTIAYPPSEYGNSIVYLLVKPYYLHEDEVIALSEQLKFPANSSEQTKQELDYLLELQHKRTPEEITRVQFLGDIGYWPSINMVPSHPSYHRNLTDLFFEAGTVLGENIHAQNFPKISKLLQGVMQDMRIMEFTIKYKHLRPRPYHLAPTLQPLAKISSPSYVSGHTLWAFLQAFTWSEIVPARQKEFIALAEEIRRSREIMGIHYPSDNEAARQVAYKMLQAYFKKASFRTDLDAAIHEWKTTSRKYIP
jgi:acid phosphatase (class A)